MAEATITITLTPRERAAVDEIRAVLGFRSDEAVVFGGLYKLAAWIDPAADPALFRLDRDTALRPEPEPEVEPLLTVEPEDPDESFQPSLFRGGED